MQCRYLHHGRSVDPEETERAEVLAAVVGHHVDSEELGVAGLIWRQEESLDLSLVGRMQHSQETPLVHWIPVPTRITTMTYCHRHLYHYKTWFLYSQCS